MAYKKFKIELKKIHWLKSFGEEDNLDLCAHGKITVTIGDETVVSNSSDPNDWWALTATGLHLLRTLEMDHVFNSRVGDCLVPGEGHHIDHQKDDYMVHIETVYPMVKGRNWWVKHENNKVSLTTESKTQIVISFEDYKYEVLKFVDQVENFYHLSKPKTLPEDEYDKEAYLKLWHEWKTRRNKWK